ncbi:MAG: hypothetical protein PHG54_09240 [Smithellaceae bacterium]|nr:hypothetical protein [Smithellaceae bacterium]
MKTSFVAIELKAHAPFTAFGTVTGIVIMAVFIHFRIPGEISSTLFWTMHPLHVLLSALVTTAMYRLHSGGGVWRTILIGYFGSVGIATLSDSLIPFAGEWLLDLPYRGIHLGFIEKWWLVNPLALAGIGLGFVISHTKIPHAGHVLLSTWASLFHILMALGTSLDVFTMILIAVFLFLAVWIPCCTSDIVFPLLWIKKENGDGKRPISVTDGGMT